MVGCSRLASFHCHYFFRSRIHYPPLRLFNDELRGSELVMCYLPTLLKSIVMTLYRHVTLMTISVALVATAFNIFAARRLPMFEGMILYLHILLWFGVGVLFFSSYSTRIDICSSIFRSGSLPRRYQLLKCLVTSRTGVDGQPWVQQ
jgi:hypothetical protein